jgi:hypothetical protein
MTTSNQTQTTINTKKHMTPAQIAFYTGKRIDTVKWVMPEGYDVCRKTYKMLPVDDLLVTFPSPAFTNEQLREIGGVEDAEPLSQDGYEMIMMEVEARGWKPLIEDYYDNGFGRLWTPRGDLSNIPAREDASEELPAKMPRDMESAIMDEDTNPIIETAARAINTFTAGQTVTYTSIHGKTYTGVVVSVLYDYDFPLLPRAKYEVRMNGNRHTTVYYPRELKAAATQNTVDLYQAMKEAEETYIHYMRMDTFDLPADHATYKRKVASHIAYLQAQAAFTGLSNDALIVYLYGKNALQSTQKANSSPSTASQVTASEMAETPAPLTQADGDTWLSRMRARELSFAKQAAKQWGIAPSDAPRQPAPVTVKPPRAMTPAEQANHDVLQKMIDASRKAN